MKKKIASALFLLIIFVALTGCVPQDLFKPNSTSSETINSGASNDKADLGIKYEEFQIHFLELDNEYAGDAIYIKANETDILIDSGSRKSSAETIKNYIDNYCTDGKIEYVISTHAHQDHIAGFVGTSSNGTKNGIFYQFEIGTIIDFALTNSTSQLYNDYLDAVDFAVERGTTHYTADECFGKNSADKNNYQIAENITMNILYNKYYFEASSDENNYSVCTMFTYGNQKYLFTGDLELEGEEALVEHYKEELTHCVLFKAGHHGSKTSSNEVLLSKITPDICVITCCAGSDEYTSINANTFPTQGFINRIAKYTDQVYITSKWDEKTYDKTSMNGNVVISSNGTDVGVWASDNTTKLKDTEWFSHLVNVDTDGKLTEDSNALTTPCRTLPIEWEKENKEE